ncbi:MAG: hypothetical protein KDA24_14250 [Deltaproteobacteria bacterium]|nr:hypothetical protein [Deltaproteobacteria bacterium]
MTKRDQRRRRREAGSHTFADTVVALTEIAPRFPPALVAHGLELTHSLRRTVGGRAKEPSLWEELLALRRGPGADNFLATPICCRPPVDDLLLERAVEIRAIVDALRGNQHSFDGQPLNRALEHGFLRTRRVVMPEETVPVVVRLAGWYAVVDVHDEHPRVLRERIVHALETNARPLRSLMPTRVRAAVVVSVLPVPFKEAAHLHRLGVGGPWLGWSETSTEPRLDVLSAHGLVLDGPGFYCLRAEIRRRVRAMRIALGLETVEEEYGDNDDAIAILEAALAEADEGTLSDLGLGEGAGIVLDRADPSLDPFPFRHEFADGDGPERPSSPDATLADLPDLLSTLPASLVELAGQRSLGWVGPRNGPTGASPSLRYATVPRSAFSMPDFAYAFCRAQHEAMAIHHPSYDGRGFTFVIPHEPRDEIGRRRRGVRAGPVLCSFRTRRGVPESAGTFKRRLQRRLDEADRGEDLLSQVLDDVLRAAVPETAKALMVRLAERMPGDGGTFLTGRGLVAWSEVPDESVDPFAEYGGVFEGFFTGSCHERGGVSLSAVDRGCRRDLCAVGSGVFRRKPVMDHFWRRLAFFLSDSAL